MSAGSPAGDIRWTERWTSWPGSASLPHSGTTDDTRMRHLTLALPPEHAARLFDAREQGATDRELQQTTADALGDVYFRDSGRRAHDLLVELTDIEWIEFEL